MRGTASKPAEALCLRCFRAENSNASVLQTEARTEDGFEEVALAGDKTMDTSLSQALSTKSSPPDSDGQLNGEDQAQDIAFQSELNVFTGLKFRGR